MTNQRELLTRIDTDYTDILRDYRKGKVPVMNFKSGRECSLACVYCDTWRAEPSEEVGINRDDLSLLINDWADMGGKVLHWCGDGEPTEFKHFDLLLDLCEEHGIRLEMFSNLMGLNEKRAKKLMEMGAIVRFKMDSRDSLTFGNILVGGKKELQTEESKVALGKFVLGQIDMLVEARNSVKGEFLNQLVASIVVTSLNYRDIPKLLEWCCEYGVVPQVDYVEPIGRAEETGVKAPDVRKIKVLNRFIRMKYGINPKSLMGDNCHAYAAPIVASDKVLIGPWGLGCEFVSRNGLGRKEELGKLNEGLAKLDGKLREFRFSEENIRDIISELMKVKDREGVYALSGTDEVLPGCGDDIEELWLLKYVATLFSSDEYFEKFIARIEKGEHRKWTSDEVDELIDEVRNFKK